MIHRVALLAAILLYVAAPRAQDAAAPAPDRAPPAHTERETPPPADEEPVTAPPATTTATGPSPDSFNPSEEISEDLSVSFPVDI